MRSFWLFPISNHATKHKEPIPKLPLLQRNCHCSRSGNDFLLYHACAHWGVWKLDDPHNTPGARYDLPSPEQFELLIPSLFLQPASYEVFSG